MYTSSKNDFTLKDGQFVLSPFFIKDAPQKGDLLAQYINDARGIFVSECNILMSTEREFSEHDGDRLVMMLKLLVDARKTWQEEEVSKKKA